MRRYIYTILMIFSFMFALMLPLSVYADEPTILGSRTMEVGETCRLGLDSNYTLEWESSNTKVATIASDGTVTGKKAGTCTMTTWYNGTYYGVEIVVKGTAASSATIKLNKTKLTLTVGETASLKLKSAKASKVKWSSKNKKIATVSQKGLVKGKKKGTAKIIAKYKKKTYKCTVTVKAKPESGNLTRYQAYDRVVKKAKANKSVLKDPITGGTIYVLPLGGTSSLKIWEPFDKTKGYMEFITSYPNGTYVDGGKTVERAEDTLWLRHYRSAEKKDYVSFYAPYDEDGIQADGEYSTSKLGRNTALSYVDKYWKPTDGGIWVGRYSKAYAQWDKVLIKKTGISMKQLGFKN